jgi:hypothetical protein
MQLGWLAPDFINSNSATSDLSRTGYRYRLSPELKKAALQDGLFTNSVSPRFTLKKEEASRIVLLRYFFL